MSANYPAVSWTPFKKKYDLILWLFNFIYLGLFILLHKIIHPSLNDNTTLIRAFGTLAIIHLHFILWIGPASRFNKHFLPLLYNRRHLGVSMFLISAIHGILSLLWFHGGGNIDVLTSLFTSNLHYNSLYYFPFQILGFFALLIFTIMALTSHDVWLKFFSPYIWKLLHMMVYIAYGLVMMHVALGILQYETHPILVGFLMLGFITTFMLHLAAAIKEKHNSNSSSTEWVSACDIDQLKENEAITVSLGNEKAALFLYDGKISAVHNVCKHQMGPLNEGKIINGCITCPWHGFQYQPEDGCSPPPFHEKLATYQLRINKNIVEINAKALPEGTKVVPLVIPQATIREKDFFFIGWDKNRMNLAIPSLIWALAMMIIAVLFGLSFTFLEQKISTYQIDYLKTNEIQGLLVARPFPHLIVADNKDINGAPKFSAILLVDALKKGASSRVTTYLNNEPNSYVSIKGYSSNNLIRCSDNDPDCSSICEQCIFGNHTMPLMEILSGSMGITPSKTPLIFQQFDAKSQPTNKTPITRIGEIIDPKCFFGAMNPGNGKVHLSCAVRCIEGGIIPMLRYEDEKGEHFALLHNPKGEPANDLVKNFIGLPVQITALSQKYLNWEIFTIQSLKRP